MPTILASNAHKLIGPEAAAKHAEMAQANASGRQGAAIFGADGFGFDDFLDIINPLQQLPIIGSLYRELTGDTIAPGSQLIGGSLLGGVGGFMASAANILFAQETGENGMAGSVLAALTQDVNQKTQLAFVEAGEAVAAKKGSAALASIPETEKFALRPLPPEQGMQVAMAMKAQDASTSIESIKAASVNDLTQDLLQSHLNGVRTGVIPATNAEKQYKRAQALGELEDRVLRF